MDSQKLRQLFCDFFKQKGHMIMPPSSLIPENDPTVLFTSAGMQQFKKFYTHPEEAPTKNIVTIQPCIRTSDIGEVGDDTHLTFFEMLGNFSFGGYFKNEAIAWAWDFLTKELKIEPQKISCSIFAGDGKNPRDDESAKILEKMGIQFKEHNRDDNFWGPTGNEGPCGPTVEFYVDKIEIWNLVFNEYYKNLDGKYRELATKGVDTGMGLERMLAVINHAENVFHTDLFDLSHKKLHQFLKKEDPIDERVILDHIKTSTFALNDSITISNKGQGYIIRRLIRRAIVKAKQIGIDKNFTVDLAGEIFKTYENRYRFDQKIIQDELDREETKFRNTLSQGLKIFEKRIIGGFGSQAFGGLLPKHKEYRIDGKKLFDLYQTYGFPIEISLELARQNNLIIDKKAMEDFNTELKKHQGLSRTASAGMFKGGLADESEEVTKLHTAAHLVLAALRQVLGEHVIQKGSNITPERLRLDFSHAEKLSDDQIQQIESLVNKKIKQDLPVVMEEMPVEVAKETGAMGVFNEKYGHKVKVYTIGPAHSYFSKEICGGPHVEQTGVLGHFKITKEESSSAGVRRIKAVLK